MYKAEKLKKITMFTFRGKEFLIVKDERGNFWGIETNLIDSNGHLHKELNGLQGHISATLNGCLNNSAFEAEWEYLKSNGFTETEIIQKMIHFKYPFKDEYLPIKQ